MGQSPESRLLACLPVLWDPLGWLCLAWKSPRMAQAAVPGLLLVVMKAFGQHLLSGSHETCEFGIFRQGKEISPKLEKSQIADHF